MEEVLNEILNKAPTVQEDRASGKTTRLADFYIQELFTNKGTPVKIVDHSSGGEDHNANRHLCGIIINRLFGEHAYQPFEYDKDNTTITMIL